MLQIRTIVGGQVRYLDLLTQDPIIFEISFLEIQDITSRNSTYTKTFILPGSKNNDDILNYFFVFNSTMTDFDPRKKFEAQITYNNQVLYDGYIRLEQVAVNNTEHQYTITFYSEVGDLVSNIGDKFLAQLDLSSLSHPYNPQMILDNFVDPDLLPPPPGSYSYEDGRTYWPLLARGYIYDNPGFNPPISYDLTPILDFNDGATFGYFDYPGTPVRYTYFSPSIQVRELYSQILSQSGYNLNSDFMDTSYFKRFYFPLTFTDTFGLAQGVDPVYTYTAGTPSFTGLTTFTWTDFDSLGTSQFIRNNQFTVVADNMNASVPPNYPSFYIQTKGEYVAKMTLNVYNPSTTTSTDLQVHLHAIFGNNPNGTTGFTAAIDGRTILPGQTDTVVLTFSWLAQDYVANYYALDFQITGSFPILGVQNFSIIQGPKTVPANVNYATEFPQNELTQIEFIQSVNKLFNLVVVADKDDIKTLRVEPVIDYVGTGPIYDWTRLVDRNQTIVVKPTTSIINGTLVFSYTEEKDYGNTEFIKKLNKTFGTRFEQLNQDYKDNKIDISTIFVNSVDYVLNNIDNPDPNITLPYYHITGEIDVDGVPAQQFDPFKIKPRLLYRGPQVPIINLGTNISPSGNTVFNNWFLESTTMDSFPVNNRFNTYPLALNGFSHYINTNGSDRFDYYEKNFSDYPDLYDIYYSEYIDDLTSEENRVISGKVLLTVEDIRKYDFSEKIFFDGNYYRINKISFPMKGFEALADFELVKITRDYTPHPVFYFELLSCDGEAAPKYTNTDLSASLVSYIGLQISISGICYTIQRDEYDPNVVYEKIEITAYQNNSTLPLFYQDCECSVPIDRINIIEDIIPSPTPSPVPPTPTPTPITPTPTPTPSSTPGPDVYYYEARECGFTDVLIVQSASPLIIGQVVKVATACGEGIEVCFEIIRLTAVPGCNPVVSSYESCASCNGTLPSPTAFPSQTPTRTPTPTPSATPALCDCTEYYIENFNPFSVSVQYDDCDRVPQNPVIAPDSFIVDCLCDGTLVIPSGVEGRFLGECIE